MPALSLLTLRAELATDDNHVRRTMQQNLRLLIAHWGLTQLQAAERLGVKRSCLGSYLEGRAVPPLALLLRIAHLANLSLDQLVGNPHATASPAS